MSAHRLDPALAFPRAARDPGTVGEADGGLSRTAPADDRRRHLTGARSRVGYTRRSGVQGVAADGVPLVGRIEIDGGGADGGSTDRVTETPRTLFRPRFAPGLDEVVVVPERLPGAAVQWVARGDGATAAVALSVELPRPDDGGGLRIAHGGPLLRWAGPAEPGGAVLQLTGPGAAEGWTVVERGGRTVVQATLHPAADHPVTLLVSAVDAEGRLPSLAALAALTAHRTRDRLEPDEAEGVVLQTGRPELDRGVAWARSALRARLQEGSGTPPVRGPGLGELLRGALAAGESDVANATLGALAPTTLADAEALVLAVAWREQVHELVAQRAALDRVAATAPMAFRLRLADAAEAMVQELWAAQLRRPPSKSGGRRLPTVGRTASTAPPEAAEPDPALSPPLPPSDEVPETPSVADLERALAAARGEGVEWSARVLERTLERLADGDIDPGGSEAALALDLLVRGVLGVVPDAGFGRIDVAPALPASWGAVTVRGLALGDARVGLRVAREGDRIEIALHQTAGGAPVTWILAPRLEAAAVRAVWIDGETAELDVDDDGSRIQPRVQLPAEQERLVVFEVTPR